MTTPSPEVIENEKDKLFVTDAELIRRLGVPERVARDALRHFDANPEKYRFPAKQAAWGNRRFWPAVESYLYRTNGLTMVPPSRREIA